MLKTASKKVGSGLLFFSSESLNANFGLNCLRNAKNMDFIIKISLDLCIFIINFVETGQKTVQWAILTTRRD